MAVFICIVIIAVVIHFVGEAISKKKARNEKEDS